MWRALILIAVACSSKSGDTPVPTPAPEPAPKPTPDAGKPWPSEFPAKGAAAITGKLVGKPFKVAKAMVGETGGADVLTLYAWKAGQDCEPQFAPDDNQLYIEVQFPRSSLKAGTQIRGGDLDTIATYKHHIDLDHYVHDDFALQVDEVTPKHVVARLWFTSEDGSAAAGTIDAVMCASAQPTVDNAEPVLGRTWGETSIATATLPSAPLVANYLGKRVAPLSVEVVDWQNGKWGQHEVHIFMTPPKQPCLPDLLGTGFKIGFPKPIALGQSFSAAVTTVTITGNPWAVVEWQERGNVVGMEGNGRAAATIDAVHGDEIRGRVFAWFEDSSKSMVGAFVAKLCHIKFD